MNPNQSHWRLIRLIYWDSTPDCPSIHLSRLSERMRIDESICRSRLLEMSDPSFSEFGPWVERVRGDFWGILGVRRDNFLTGGYMALDLLKKNVGLENVQYRDWCNLVQAGIDANGDETKIQNAVIPKFTHYQTKFDPEGAADSINQKFVERENIECVNENGDKLCPRCPPWAKRPVHKKSKYCSGHQRRKNRSDYRARKLNNGVE